MSDLSIDYFQFHSHFRYKNRVFPRNERPRTICTVYFCEANSTCTVNFYETNGTSHSVYFCGTNEHHSPQGTGLMEVRVWIKTKKGREVDVSKNYPLTTF